MTNTSMALLMGALLASVPATAMQPASSASPELSLPSLDALEPSVRAQLEEALATLAQARVHSPGTAALGEAYGALGQLLLAYDLTESAATALEAATQLDREEPRWPYLLGSLHQLDSDFDRAAEILRTALARAPGDAATRARLALVELGAGRTTEAAELVAPLERAPGYEAVAHFVQGRAAFDAGELEQALRHFDRALELQPSATVVHYHRALTYRDRGDSERAREAMALRGDTEVGYADPITAEVAALLHGVGPSLTLARLRLAAGDLAGAVDQAETALGIDPDNATVLRTLASLRQRQERFDDAVALYERSLVAEPADAGLRFYLAGLLAGHAGANPLPADETARRSRLERALGHIGTTLEQVPEFVPAWREQAAIQLELGRAEDALRSLDRAVELAPGEPWQRIERARLRAQLGNLEGALEDGLAAESGPLRSQALLVTAPLLARAGRRLEALEHWQEIAEGTGEAGWRGVAEFHLANAAAEAGDPSAAEAGYQRAISLAPELVEARFNLGTLLGRAGRFAEAAKEQMAAVELRPDHHEARYGAAMALVLDGQLTEAKRLLEDALARFPSVPVYAHLLARILVAAPDAALRDGMTGLDIAARLFQALPSMDHAETVAMAFAEVGRFDRAIEWQEQVVEKLAAEGEEALLATARGRLEGYRRSQPVRSPWQ